MFHYRALVEDMIVELIFDDKEYLLLITLKKDPNFIINEIQSEHAKIISSELACSIGAKPAAAFLHYNKVDKNSNLWFLNHTGYIPMTNDEIRQYIFF